MTEKNVMQIVQLEKVTLNIGAGKDQRVLEKGIKLIQNLTGRMPVKTKTPKRIPSWGLRPGLPIGCKLTLRRDQAKKIIERLLYAKDNKLKASQFDNCGNISFGIPEYIDIKEAEYDAEIGVMGLECAITLKKPGFRVKRRIQSPAQIGKNQKITKEEAIKFMQDTFKVMVE